MVRLTSNQISAFPTPFCGLKQLALLDLSNNTISELPSDIQKLEAVELNLNDNKVRSEEMFTIFPQRAMHI